ncbi:MAG: TRAP transporter small permease subunit [Pseudomonadota bacterium]
MTVSSVSEQERILPYGQPAPVVRFFGWASLFTLAAFLVNNVLIGWFDFPTLGSIGAGGADPKVFVVLIVYILGLLGAGYWVWHSGNTALRYDAKAISDFNAYLIRGCFFAVLFVGLADVIIAFMRVEDMITGLIGEDSNRALTRAQFVGRWVHTPLVALGFVIALITRTLGFHWLALMIVGAELLIVISRFVFSYEQALMGDLVRYWYAALFLFASAYTLLEEGHVRVDVFYAGLSPRRKGRVNAVGSILLGMVTCWCIIFIGLGSPQAIVNSPIKNFEVSQAGTAGMYIKYQMAGFLAIFAITMLIQFVSYLFEAVADARGEPGHKDHVGAAH